MSRILKGLNESRDSWDSNMPGYKGDYGGAENWGRRNREWDEDDRIDAQIRQRHAEKMEYEKSGKFWLKLKDTQQHLPAGPFIGKQAANTAALDLLKQQPELKGNLLITAYGPDEQINELSPQALANYKKAAGADASKSDRLAQASRDINDTEMAQKLTNRANKRFGGIVKATKKEFDNDAKGLAEGSQTEGEATLAKIAASGDDGYEMIYDGLNGLLGTEAQIILQDMYDDVSIEHRLHPDDDFEAIQNRMMDRIEKDYGVNESYYDRGDYYDARMGGEYGRNLTPQELGGAGRYVARGDGDGEVGRPAKVTGVTNKLPADPFGRTSGVTPKDLGTGRIHRIAGPGDEVDEGIGADMAKLGGMAAIGIGAGLAGNYADQQQTKVEVGGQKAYLVKNPGWGRVPDNAMTLQGKDGKTYTVWAAKGKGTTQYYATPSEVKEETNPHTSAIGKALFRDLSKEKKASPAQVKRNEIRWAQRQKARAEQPPTKGMSDAEKVDKGWRNPNIDEGELNESSTIDFIRGLISEFNTQMSGSPYYPMDYKNPGMRMWTRGDGSKYKDPGYIFIDRDLKPEDQPKWHKAKAVEKFWKFLESKGARKIGDVSGEFGSDPHSPAVVLNKQVFVFNGRSIAWGSTSRLKNSSVWRQKQQGVAEDDAGDVEQRMLVKIEKEKQRLAQLKKTDPEAYKREMAKREQSRNRMPAVSTFEQQGVTEGWVDTIKNIFKRKPKDNRTVFEKDPEAMREFERSGGYEAGLDIMGWQIGWFAAEHAQGDTMEQAFSKLYYGGGSPMPFDNRSFKLAWVAYNKHHGPQVAMEGPVFDKWADERVASQLYKLKPFAIWEVSFDYGPHMSDSVKVKARSEEEAIAKVEKAADKQGRNIMINWARSQEQDVTEDWQKVNKKDKTDGMSRKAVKAYRRENPGSKLKTAVTTKPSKLKKGSKSAKRRKSFCARMSGMKKAHASAKTKRDPDSPINKALRRWNCESVEQLQELMMIAEQKVKQLREAANPAQQAAIAISKKKEQGVAEEKQRLDAKCWTGYKKQGTKMKGDTRVNNCVPIKKESAIEKGLVDENLGMPNPGTYEQETAPLRRKLGQQERVQKIAFEGKKNASR